MALGGLYDSAIYASLLEDSTRGRALNLIPAVSAQDLCQLLREQDHLAGVPRRAFSSEEWAELKIVDGMGHTNPRAHRCDMGSCSDGSVVVSFQETVAMENSDVPGRRQVCGAIRFLDGRFNSVQLVQALPAPSPEEIGIVKGIVCSCLLAKEH